MFSVQDLVPPSWKMRFAPHIGLNRPDSDGLFQHIAGDNVLDQIALAADLGFAGIEDNFLQWRPKAVQEKIGEAMARHSLEMGCFVGTRVYDRPTFVLGNPEERERLIAELHETIEVAKRVGGKWITTLSSLGDPRLSHTTQTDNMIENLKPMAAIAEHAGVVLLIEAINSIDYPGTFVTNVMHANEIVKQVGSPSVRLMFDVFHAQIGGGDLIRTIDRTWEQIGFVQIADNPGRFEPGMGEINYTRVLQHLKNKGYTGLVEMEHAASQPDVDGERAVIAAYIEINDKLA